MMDEERFYDTHPDLKAQRTFLSLMIAGDFRGAHKFIEYGVDVDTRWGPFKRTALHTAALENDPQAIVQLLKWGATKSLEDTLGKTALDLAESESSNDAITALGVKARNE
jgi:ankyrin repeat protein